MGDEAWHGSYASGKQVVPRLSSRMDKVHPPLYTEDVSLMLQIKRMLVMQWG